MPLHRRTLAPLALVLCAATTAAEASLRAWSLCTPGALRSCHSVSIATLPVISGGIRTGTAITISVTNLQGSGLPNTSSLPTGLYQLVLTGPITTPIQTTAPAQSAVMTGAGATGALAWQRITLNAAVGGLFAWIELRGIGSSPALLGGCTSGATIVGAMTARTCGAGAAAVFAFSIQGVIEATQLDNLSVFAYGARGSATCFSNPGAVPFHGQACDVLSDPLAPVPEPGTLIMLATGLLGVGGGGARRRRRATAPES